MLGFQFVIPYSVHVADVNYGGHVANSAVLNFFQDARIRFLADLGPFSEKNIGEDCGIIQSEAHVYYRSEMFLHDELKIGVRVIDVKRSSFSLAYRVERDGQLTAEGTTTLAGFSYSRGRIVRLPEPFRAALAAAEKA